MNNSKKILTFLSLIILSLMFSVIAGAQTVEIIKYGTAGQVAQPIDSGNVLINKYSSDYDFSTGAAERNPAVCICSSSYDKVYVTNTAPYEATFTILTSIPQYAIVPYSNFKVLPGQTAEVLILINAGCGETEDILDYNILVSNNFGTQYTIERELQINRCQSIDATLYVSENKILPCEKANYTIELKNTASFTEQYIVSPKNTQFFDNAQYEVTLEPGKIAYLNFLYAPDCNIYGTKTIGFNIQSVSNKLTANLEHELNIERAYDFEVTAPATVDLCREDSKPISIMLKNNAGFENEFYLTIVNKQDFLSSDAYYAKLASGEEREFLITALPTKTTKSEQVLDFEIKTELGDLSYRGKINLNVGNCYILDLNIISDNNPELCAGTYIYDIVVENYGNFRERITLTDNSEYAEVFPSTIILNSGENQTAALSLSLPDEKTALQFKVTATLDNGKVWEDELTVKVQRKYDCTEMQFNKEKIYARYGAENVSFTVTNKGKLETTYALGYEGPGFISLEDKNITLKPRESGRINLSLYSDDSEALRKYNFKVFATALNGAMYENDMTLKMTRTPLLQRIYNAATADTCTSVSSLLLLLLAIGIVAVIILAWKRVRVPLAFKLIAIGLILLIIIAVLVFNGFPQSRYPPINKELVNQTNIIWHEDRTETVDLNGYFYDPDNDTLSFTVDAEPENISIEIIGSKAKFTPDKDWAGTARIRFIASDSFGGTATSERVNLEVIEVPEFSYPQFYANNCVYLNSLLLIILLSLIFLLRTRKEKDLLSRKVALIGVRKQKGFLYFLDKDGDVSRVPMMRKNKKKQSFKKEKVGKTVAVAKKRK